jgi:hypothetical protein
MSQSNEYPASLSLSISENEEASPRSVSSSASTEDEFAELMDEIIGPESSRPVRTNAVGPGHAIFKGLLADTEMNAAAAPAPKAATSAASAAAAAPPPRPRVPTLTEEWVEEQRVIAENSARIQKENAAQIQRQKDQYHFLSKEEKVEFNKKQQNDHNAILRDAWNQCMRVEDARVKALRPALPGLPENAVPASMKPMSQQMRLSLSTGTTMTMALAAVNKPVVLNGFAFMQPDVFKLLEWEPPSVDIRQQHPRLVVWCQKLDGNRALWDGFNGRFYSKSLKRSVSPRSDWLIWMPRNVYLDGELYTPSASRGPATEFESDMHRVAKVWSLGAASSMSSLWEKLEFHAFDIIGNSDVLDTAWQNRNALLRNLNQKGEISTSAYSEIKPMPDNQHFRRVQHYYLEAGTLTHVYTQIAQAMSYVRARGGEGILLKEVSSRSKYKPGSTSNLWLKLKFYEDGEARVLSRFTSKEGLPGVAVQLSNGRECNIVRALHKLLYPSPDRLPPNTIVNIQYHAVESSGKLREPKITGVHTSAIPAKENFEEWKRITKGKVYSSSGARAGATAAAMDSAAAAWDSAAALEGLE